MIWYADVDIKHTDYHVQERLHFLCPVDCKKTARKFAASALYQALASRFDAHVRYEVLDVGKPSPPKKPRPKLKLPRWIRWFTRG